MQKDSLFYMANLAVEVQRYFSYEEERKEFA